MRVMVVNRPDGAFGYITDGFVNALNHLGHITQRWDGSISQWNSFNPELYIGSSGHMQPIDKVDRSNCKIAMHVNPYCNIKTGVNEPNESIRKIEKLKPDLIFGYGAEHDRHFWADWKKFGLKWIPMPTAADSIIYKKLNIEPIYDLIYVGGKWAYKGKTIDKYLLPVLQKIKNYKLHGWGEWGEISSGTIEDKDVNQFLQSGKIGPCICEHHTHIFGFDIPERAFKLACVGTLFVHDSPSIKKMIPDAVVANDYKEYLELIEYYLNNESERTRVANLQHEHVMKHHTYINRMSLLLSSL